MNDLNENGEHEIRDTVVDEQVAAYEDEGAGEIDQSSEPEEENKIISPFFSIAGFWRRFFSFLVDGVLLAIPLLIIGFLFRDFAFRLGPYGRLFGYTIIIAYWAWFNSEKGHGQTVGKRVLNITVVDQNNQYLPVSKSFLRALTLGLVFMLNGWALPLLQNPILATIVTVVVFGGILAISYGLVFNRATRQGVHDFFAHSYVINTPPVPEAIPPALPKIHRRITYGLLGVGLMIALIGLIFRQSPPDLGIMEEGEWEEVIALQEKLSEHDDVFSVGVNRLNRTSLSDRTTILKDLNIDVWISVSCKNDPTYCDALMDEIARTAMTDYDHIDNLDGMRIAIINRFDLGIANGSLTQGAELRMEDWQERLQQSE